MSYNAYKLGFRLTAQLSESTFIFNTWIISPPMDSESPLGGSVLSPILRSIIYAVSEPLYTSLLARTQANGEVSCFLILATGIHFMLSGSYWMRLNDSTDARVASCWKTLEIAKGMKPKERKALVKEKRLEEEFNRSSNARDLGWKELYCFTFVHVQLAAACNAALLFVAQTLDVARIGSFTAHICALVAGHFYFFLSWIGMCYFARSAYLPIYYGQRVTANMAAQQMVNLLLLIAIRAAIRCLLGFTAFAGAWGNDEACVEKFSGDLGFGDLLRGLPRWLLPGMIVLILVLNFLGAWLRGARSARVRQGRVE